MRKMFRSLANRQSRLGYVAGTDLFRRCPHISSIGEMSKSKPCFYSGVAQCLLTVDEDYTVVIRSATHKDNTESFTQIYLGTG
jgi:hypothetical protein